MLQGWVGGGQAFAVPEMPGYKRTVFHKGDYQVVDQYGSIDEKSTGTTSILFEGKTIWFMSYMGYYRKEDIPILKALLKKTYEKGEFIGGRGPVSAIAGPECILYTNLLVERSSFKRFRGEETLCDSLGIRGCHGYWGAEVRT